MSIDQSIFISVYSSQSTKDNITQVQFFQNLNLHWKFTETLSLYDKFPMEIKKFEKLKWSDIVFTANII